jgi:hypothetical protein
MRGTKDARMQRHRTTPTGRGALGALSRARLYSWYSRFS